jgi:hypothetical protein
VAAFKDTAEVAARAFGGAAFRKFSPLKHSYDSTVSNAVFDTVMLTIDSLITDDGSCKAASKRGENRRWLLQHTDTIRATLEGMFWSDPEWTQLICRPTTRTAIGQRSDRFKAALLDALQPARIQQQPAAQAPRSRGGPPVRGNAQLTCITCNRSKGASV